MDKIVIKFKDKEYTLEFNRNSVVKMERDGFEVSKAEERPLSTLVELSRGAFIMHHPNMKDNEIDEIVDNIQNKTEFVNVLAEMYKNVVECIIKDKVNKEGNATWAKA